MTPSVEEALKRLQMQHETLLEDLAIDGAEAEEAYAWLDLVDLLSLVACNRWPTLLRRSLPDGTHLQIHWDGEALRLDPLLLAGNTTLEVPLRRLERQTFGRSLDYAMALARASWQVRDLPIRGPAADSS